MTNPATLGMLASGAGTGLNVAGNLFGGSSKSKAYMYQSKVAEINAKIEKQNAEYARTVGERENLRFGLKAGQRMGAIKAAQGASGLDIASEGAQSVRDSQAFLDAIDRQQISDNAARRAYGHEISAHSQIMKAKGYKAAASDAKRAGWIQAATSLASGAASVHSKWLQGKQSGMWGQTSDFVSGAIEPDYYGPDFYGAY